MLYMYALLQIRSTNDIASDAYISAASFVKINTNSTNRTNFEQPQNLRRQEMYLNKVWILFYNMQQMLFFHKICFKLTLRTAKKTSIDCD